MDVTYESSYFQALRGKEEKLQVGSKSHTSEPPSDGGMRSRISLSRIWPRSYSLVSFWLLDFSFPHRAKPPANKPEVRISSLPIPRGGKRNSVFKFYRQVARGKQRARKRRRRRLLFPLKCPRILSLVDPYLRESVSNLELVYSKQPLSEQQIQPVSCIN